MTKPVSVSLARRFAYTAALLAGIAMLAIAGASWWLINQAHAASLRSLLQKDAKLQAATIGNDLDAIATGMSEITNRSLIANALFDNADKERLLIPYLTGIRRIHGVPVDILFTDFEGREIARNGNGSFSEQELNWLREKFPAGQPASRVQLGEKGEELLAVEFIVLSRSNLAEGALLYRVKLNELSLQKGVRLVRGKESEKLLYSQAARVATLDVPPIYKNLDFAVLTILDPTASQGDWQSLGVFFILAVGMVVAVIMLGLHFGKRLTKDLEALDFFARDVAEKGFGTGRAKAADSLEVASLAQSINHMLGRLKQQHDKLNESEERFRSVFEYSKVGINVQAVDGRFLEVNPAFVEMTGYSKEELLRINFREITHPDEVESGVAMGNPLRAGESDYFHLEKRYIRKDGSTLWADVTVSANWDDARKLVSVIGIAQDITERKQAETEAQRVSDLLRGSIDVLDEAFVLFDPQDRLVLCNDKYREAYSEVAHLLVPGAQFEDIIRAGAEMGQYVAAIGRVDQWVAERLATHLAANTTLIQKHSNGRTLRIVERRLPDGHIAGFRVDITQIIRVQDEILRLNASLEERVQQRTEEIQSQQEKLHQSNKELEEKAAQLTLTSKYKSEFLSSMSHELRTPLNSLLILAQLLAENAEHNLSRQQIEYAKTIQGAGKDLLMLISDILDLSKIESGTVTPALQDVSFATIREQTERAFRHVAQSRGIGFGVELAPGLPESLYTDAQRLQQVLKNLLSNAFKFTEKGQVSVRIAPVESGLRVEHDGLNRAQTMIGFYVTDSGIGLATTKQKIIFEAFQQADTGTARKYGGTGLGLSISREIAWLLGGELQLAESQPGQGSTFVLTLPLRAPESGQGATSFTPDATQRTPAAAARAADALPQPTAVADDRAAIKPEEPLLIIEDDADLAGKKVLVVDDDVRNIFALTAVLERHKMAVLTAENGHIALEELSQNPDVDIVLMDIMMPEMDGFETMRQIRQIKQFESLPMIALTAKAMKGDREKCIEAGASDYVSKPIDTGQLLSLLRVWLYR